MESANDNWVSGQRTVQLTKLMSSLCGWDQLGQTILDVYEARMERKQYIQIKCVTFVILFWSWMDGVYRNDDGFEQT